MKALVKFIITGAFLFPILSVVISCSEEADCSMATRAMMQCYFYTLDPETEVVSNDTLTSDYDPKNTFDIEKYLNRKEKIQPGDEFIVVDADSLPSA